MRDFFVTTYSGGSFTGGVAERWLGAGFCTANNVGVSLGLLALFQACRWRIAFSGQSKDVDYLSPTEELAT